MALFAAVLLIASADRAGAQQEPGKNPDKIERLSERFYFRIGTYAVGYAESSLNLFSSSVLGANIDLRRDLELENPAQSARFDGYYRFNRRHALGFSYYALSQEGATETLRDITLPDPDDPDGST